MHAYSKSQCVKDIRKSQLSVTDMKHELARLHTFTNKDFPSHAMSASLAAGGLYVTGTSLRAKLQKALIKHN